MSAALRAHAKLVLLRPFKIVWWIVGLVIIGAVGWNFERSAADVVFGVAFVAAVLLATSLFSIFVIAPMTARRQFRQRPALARQQLVWWDDRGLHMRNENGEMMSPWADFYAHYQTRQMFMLYHSSSFFGLMPQRVLTDEDRAELLGHLAKAGVPDRRKPKRRR